MIGLMFHHLHGGDHPQVQGSFSAQELAQVIEKHRHRLLPAKEFMARALEGTCSDGAYGLTFDDGLRCQYDLARLGYRLGFNATPHAGSSLLELGRIDAADVRP